VQAGEAKALVIVAPPRALGVMRNAYSQNLRAALRAEIDKDLVKLPLHKIEEQLTGKDLGRS
jgi:protein required for attachment to host cells